MNPDHARALLTAELEELGDRAEFAASSAAESASGDLAANEAGTTQHPADFGTEVTNRMESEGLVRTVELQRRRVQDALDRLDEGTYGRCAVCGVEIDDERLEAARRSPPAASTPTPCPSAGRAVRVSHTASGS